jgi:hypothetical protein
VLRHIYAGASDQQRRRLEFSLTGETLNSGQTILKDFDFLAGVHFDKFQTEPLPNSDLIQA